VARIRSGLAWAAPSGRTRWRTLGTCTRETPGSPSSPAPPQAEIQRLKERHGWNHIPWYTITDDFDKDFDVEEWHGTNAFIREGGRIFRTYFINDRGDEQMGNTWNYLDITALGRQETWEDSPEGYPQTPPYQWWNYHDVHDTAK
jgi:predicted dithiol-disulfide oxidoreductase (DUF899 family)